MLGAASAPDVLTVPAANRVHAGYPMDHSVLEGGENTLRLAYSGLTPEQIDEGVQRLAAAYRAL